MSGLIIGGTSGLGLELARDMAEHHERVIVTGRHDPGVDFAEYRQFDLAGGDLPQRVGRFVLDLPPVGTLVYAAGFYQEGHIADLSDEEVDTMINVGERGLIFFTKKLLEKQRHLDELITITSTSQWTAREREPVYTAAKAGAGHYSHSLSLDPSIGRTRVIGMSGMRTAFWDGTEKDTEPMLDPAWVAERIMELRGDSRQYLFARILGQTELPQRVEVES